MIGGDVWDRILPLNWIKLAVDIDMVLCNYVLFIAKVLELFR